MIIKQTVLHEFSRKSNENNRKSKNCLNGVVFLFSGQGSQYSGMGKMLYKANEDFKVAMDNCDSIYRTLSKGESLLEFMFSNVKDDGIVVDLEQTEIAQPALVALEWSLAEMWRANGVTPSVVLGHSVGEIAAACVAGGMTIETGLRVATMRGQIMQRLPSNNGVMVAVRCSLKDVQETMLSCLDDDEYSLVGVASINGPNSIVISGKRNIIEKMLEKLGKEGIFLNVSHAFHSPLMKDAEDEYRSYLESLDIHQQPLSIPLASTVSGEVIPIGESLDVEHWVKQVTAPVLFSNALVKVLNVDEYKLDVNINHSSKVGVVIEIGPSAVLSRMAKSWWEPSISDRDPVWVTSLENPENNQGYMLSSIEDIINIVQKLFARESLTSSKLRTIFPK